MLTSRNQVALLDISSAVRKNKIVPEVNRIARPGYEVVDVSGIGFKRRMAIEAAAGLNVQEYRADGCEKSPLTAEEEFIQIGNLAENIQVLAANVTSLCSSYKIRNQCAKSSGAKRDTWGDLYLHS